MYAPYLNVMDIIYTSHDNKTYVFTYFNNIRIVSVLHYTIKNNTFISFL